MANIAELKKRNTERWLAAKFTRASEFTVVAKRLITNKRRYQEIEVKTGVPWFVIAVIHQRESSANFARSLAQGDPWDRVSTHHPAGRGPFPSFEAAAEDALKSCHPYAAKWKDWSPGGTMTLLEQYNGLAYANAGVPSPYIWSGTDQYKIGKVTRDHGPIEQVVDQQLGCAGLILAMMSMDPSIRMIKPTSTGGVVAGGVVVAGGAAAGAAHYGGADIATIAVVIALTAMIAVMGYVIIKRRKERQ